MAPLRSFDAFVKPIDGVRERSVTGGVITLLASAAAALLFLSQIVVYLQVQTRTNLHLAESAPSVLFHHASPKRLLGHHVPLTMHVTFPHLNCGALDYSHDGNSLSNGKFEHFHSAPWTFKKLA